MDSFKKNMMKVFMKIDKEMNITQGGKKNCSVGQLEDIINLLEENRLYGLFKTKGAIGIMADSFIPKESIRDKIKKLEKEKSCYYSDWKLEELNNQIKILKELLDTKED